MHVRTKIDGKNKEKRKDERQTASKEKALHGQFRRERERTQNQKRRLWMKAGELKRETESPRTSTQNKCNKKWH